MIVDAEQGSAEGKDFTSSSEDSWVDDTSWCHPEAHDNQKAAKETKKGGRA